MATARGFGASRAIIRTIMATWTKNDDPTCSPPASVIQRRRVITAAGAGWLALAGSAVVTGLGLQRFLFPNAGEEPNPRVKVGNLAELAEMPLASVNQNYKNQGFYVVRCRKGIAALSTACTHLGCALHWVAGERKFKCPCHGSGFTLEGINLEGPAPRPMERFKITVDEGVVTVDCSQVFRHEKGEWAHPDSLISI